MIEATLLGQRVDGDAAGKIVGQDGAFGDAPGGTTWVGGQPVGLTASGLVLGTQVTEQNYIGMFYNNAQIDANVGAGQVLNSIDLTTTLPTILWKGPVKVKMYKETRHNIADIRPPFASGVTWAVGDHMYIDTTQGGQWTNVSGAGQRSHGRVIVAPATVDDIMEAQMMDHVMV